MLNIFANTFRIATGLEQAHTQSRPFADEKPQEAWLPEGHWWRRSDRNLSSAEHRSKETKRHATRETRPDPLDV
ncbi:hypothetical protein [Parasedimentitalea maritima]|uniref:Uncharacterized protein n=1 Tax=Parasedimentitalea maritima TaxID=2578117 RepID=A0A6A4RLI8_9RHOB|nr:hypothetical protein [Zongyanglinia marina]KAE9632578.1 hypothetical protein GP644_02040 [Zongyanglinia marina]